MISAMAISSGVDEIVSMGIMTVKTIPRIAVGISAIMISGMSFPFSLLVSRWISDVRTFLMSFLKNMNTTASVPRWRVTSNSIGRFKPR